MKKKITKFLRCSFNENLQELSIEVFGGDNAPVRYSIGSKKINSTEAMKRIKEYWEFVDENIENGVVSDEDIVALQNFFDKLLAKGSAIADHLFDPDAQRALWKHSAESDLFVILSDVPWIPWEALYNPRFGEGAFLSDNCVLVRVPVAFDAEPSEYDRPIFVQEKLICLDSMLQQYEFRGKILNKIFEDEGEEVFVTNVISELTRRVLNTRIVYWICEHEEKQGLRLAENVHFSLDDCRVHRFPSGSVLFLVSCSGGRGLISPSFSERIVASSNCTVVAPSSVIAVDAAIDFVNRVNKIMKENGATYLHEIWSYLKGSLSGTASEDGSHKITPERCYALWFGIYGNSMARLVDGEPNAL